MSQNREIKRGPEVIAIIGCGAIGSAILTGLLTATRKTHERREAKIAHFVATTKSSASHKRLVKQYAADKHRVTIQKRENVKAMKQASIIILACPHLEAENNLKESGMQQALTKKVVISVVAGKSSKDIRDHITRGGKAHLPLPTIVRAMPNVAAKVNKSMTVIENMSEMPRPLEYRLEWIFGQVGEFKNLSNDAFKTATVLTSPSMTLITVPLEGILDGCVAEGLTRSDTLEINVRMLEGMVELLKTRSPTRLRESISTPKGCTVKGLMELERKKVRATFVEAMIHGVRRLERMENR
ncbi:pyrroline-5-carboxylate reductase dimerization-domain-containing protein [Aspergillus californicus]